MKREFEHYIVKGGKKLRYGYTTGTCAAIGAKGATEYLLSGIKPEKVEVMTPKGILVALSELEFQWNDDGVTCGVRKDGGDDIDATHTSMVYATVSKTPHHGVCIDGGLGVGRVTRKGLDQPVGAAAINRVPRLMIVQEVEETCEKHSYDGGINVVVSVPNGAEIAEKTFNPHLGIVGGISILGTSGIVEPLSIDALIATIEAEVKMLAAEGITKIIGVPGNYGEDFLLTYPELKEMPLVKYSNFLGEFLDFAIDHGMEEILLVGHIGKMIKVAGGIMNTHSRYADSRREIFAAYTALAGGTHNLIKEIMNSVTTEDCIALLKTQNLDKKVMKLLLDRIDFHATRRVGKEVSIGAVIFSSEYGLLGVSNQGERLLKGWNK